MPLLPKKISYGVELADDGVKIAGVEQIKDLNGNKSLGLISIGFTAFPRNSQAILNGRIQDKAAVLETIKKCVKTMNGLSAPIEAIMASLPNSQFYYKIIPAPSDAKTAPNAVFSAIKKYFPIDIKNVYYDWQFINDNKIALAASPKDVADSYTELLEQSGFFILALEPENMAIAKIMEHLKSPDKIILKLSNAHSYLFAIMDNTPIISIDIPLSGNMITEEISKRQNISIKNAEKIKTTCGFNITKCPPDTKKIINFLINDASQKIKTALTYANKFFKHKYDKVYICGELSKMAGITETLSKNLQINFERAQFSSLSLNKNIKIKNNDELISYVTPIGLAMRGIEKNNQEKICLC